MIVVVPIFLLFLIFSWYGVFSLGSRFPSLTILFSILLTVCSIYVLWRIAFIFSTRDKNYPAKNAIKSLLKEHKKKLLIKRNIKQHFKNQLNATKNKANSDLNRNYIIIFFSNNSQDKFYSNQPQNLVSNELKEILPYTTNWVRKDNQIYIPIPLIEVNAEDSYTTLYFKNLKKFIKPNAITQYIYLPKIINNIIETRNPIETQVEEIKALERMLNKSTLLSPNAIILDIVMEHSLNEHIISLLHKESNLFDNKPAFSIQLDINSKELDKIFSVLETKYLAFTNLLYSTYFNIKFLKQSVDSNEQYLKSIINFNIKKEAIFAYLNEILKTDAKNLFIGKLVFSGDNSEQNFANIVSSGSNDSNNINQIVSKPLYQNDNKLIYTNRIKSNNINNNALYNNKSSYIVSGLLLFSSGFFGSRILSYYSNLFYTVSSELTNLSTCNTKDIDGFDYCLNKIPESISLYKDLNNFLAPKSTQEKFSYVLEYNLTSKLIQPIYDSMLSEYNALKTIGYDNFSKNEFERLHSTAKFLSFFSNKRCNIASSDWKKWSINTLKHEWEKSISYTQKNYDNYNFEKLLLILNNPSIGFIYDGRFIKNKDKYLPLNMQNNDLHYALFEASVYKEDDENTIDISSNFLKTKKIPFIYTPAGCSYIWNDMDIFSCITNDQNRDVSIYQTLYIKKYKDTYEDWIKSISIETDSKNLNDSITSLDLAYSNSKDYINKLLQTLFNTRHQEQKTPPQEQSSTKSKVSNFIEAYAQNIDPKSNIINTNNPCNRISEVHKLFTNDIMNTGQNDILLHNTLQDLKNASTHDSEKQTSLLTRLKQITLHANQNEAALSLVNETMNAIGPFFLYSQKNKLFLEALQQNSLLSESKNIISYIESLQRNIGENILKLSIESIQNKWSSDIYTEWNDIASSKDNDIKKDYCLKANTFSVNILKPFIEKNLNLFYNASNYRSCQPNSRIEEIFGNNVPFSKKSCLEINSLIKTISSLNCDEFSEGKDSPQEENEEKTAEMNSLLPKTIKMSKGFNSQVVEWIDWQEKNIQRRCYVQEDKDMPCLETPTDTHAEGIRIYAKKISYPNKTLLIQVDSVESFLKKYPISENMVINLNLFENNLPSLAVKVDSAIKPKKRAKKKSNPKQMPTMILPSSLL